MVKTPSQQKRNEFLCFVHDFSYLCPQLTKTGNMKRLFATVYIPVAVLLLLLMVSGNSKADTLRDYLPSKEQRACRRGEVIVMYRSSEGAQQARSRSNESRLASVLNAMGAKEIRQLRAHTTTGADSTNASRKASIETRHRLLDDLMNRISLLSFDTTRVSSEEEAATMLMALNEVELAEPNLIVNLLPQPIESTDDQETKDWNSDQWYLEAINMPQLWQQPVINAKRPVVAIVDTGVDTTHPELKDCIVEGGYDFVADTSFVFDAHGHGTHCAGIVAAAGLQVKGANPDALIMPITVFDALGSGNLFNIMSGIVLAAENQADIISLSLGSYNNSSLYHNTVNTVAEQCIIVAAAGNDGVCMHSTHRDLHGIATPHLPCLPGAYETVIGVMATNEEGELASWSNFDCNGPLRGVTQTGFEGWGYQLRVPGNKILSTLPDGQYGTMSGTSMATPLAAGAISRLMQCRNFASREEMVRTLIMTTHGQIDLMAALEATPDMLHPGLFTEDIDGLTMTFKETSDGTAQLGDGQTAAVQTALVGETLTVPDEVRGLAVTTLAPHALEGCTMLKTVRLGSNVEQIDDAAFHDCSALQELIFGTRLPPAAEATAFDNQHFQTVTLRNAIGYEESYVKNFQSEAPWSSFSHWQELELTTGNRFYETIDNTRMSFIIYSQDNRIAQVGDGELCIASSRGGHLTIPSIVGGLVVMLVGEEAFNGSNLTSVTLPKTLQMIDFAAFADCKRLTNINLPDDVFYIADYAFAGCSNLQTLKLSKSISAIDNYAFAECTKLRSITVQQTDPPIIDENVFLKQIPSIAGKYDINSSDGDIYRKATLYVPEGCRDIYAEAPGWCRFSKIEELTVEGITSPASSLLTSPTVYDLTGRTIQSATTSALKKGVYVIGNRKYIKK